VVGSGPDLPTTRVRGRALAIFGRARLKAQLEEDMSKNGEPTDSSYAPPIRREVENSVTLKLVVTDPELVVEILAHEPGEDRDCFVVNALRIGILSLKQAEGRLDADAVKREAERLLSELGHSLETHRETLSEQLTRTLSNYFDPESGRFTERVERLIKRNGELEALLEREIGPENSVLALTLAKHVGEQSPLMQLLSPDESAGFIAAMRDAVSKSLENERKAILAEFTLDKEDSALSRLVGRVEKSNREVSSEFSLDDDSSALSRLKRELLNILQEHKEASDEFRGEVRERLKAMSVRRETELRSTLHGLDFEDAVYAFLSQECQRSGDIPEQTGAKTGKIKNCKVGDCVIQMGPDHVASGSRVVVEAKESVGYNLSKALQESETGRKNRGAEIGVFVFSKATAPADLEPVGRYGRDVVVIWDAQDPGTDPYLRSALAIAKALCAEDVSDSEGFDVDFESAEKAIRAIEKLSKGLDEIVLASQSIQNSGDKILERVRIMRKELTRQVGILDASVAEFRSAIEERD